LGLGSVPKGKFVVRSESLPPEEGWFDPRTMAEDTEPPPTARLDAAALV